MERLNALLNGICNLGRALIDVAKAVRFINDNQVPSNASYVVLAPMCKLVGADDDVARFKGVKGSIPNDLICSFRLKDGRRERELLIELLCPLLPEVRRQDDEDLALALCPFLSDQQTRLNSLS